MFPAQAVLFFAVLLLVGALLEPLARRLRIPISVVLVILGFAGSELLTAYGFDTGIRWHNFQSIIFHLFLPVLIFDAALRLDVASWWRELAPILLLALPLMLIAAGITALVLYYGIGHPSGFPWIAALLAGALLAATEPAAVQGLLKNRRGTARVAVILEGESLFNDVTAIVLFGLLIGVATSGQLIDAPWREGVMQFLYVFCGGLAVGTVVAILGHGVLLLLRDERIHLLITVLAAYASYLIAQDLLEFSGVMAVLAAGLVLGGLNRPPESGTIPRLVGEFWDFGGYVTERLIFLLGGATVTIAMFRDQWLAMLIGIAAVLLSRGVIVFGMLGWLLRLPGLQRLDWRGQLLVFWGGMRGAVTLALALSLPLQLDYWYTIQSVAYGVVLFTLFVQAITMDPVLRRTGV